MKIENEEFSLDYKNLEDLSYYDPNTEYIELYHLNDFAGYLKVWVDMENNEREYICINYEIVYLDTIGCINN